MVLLYITLSQKTVFADRQRFFVEAKIREKIVSFSGIIDVHKISFTALLRELVVHPLEKTSSRGDHPFADVDSREVLSVQQTIGVPAGDVEHFGNIIRVERKGKLVERSIFFSLFIMKSFLSFGCASRKLAFSHFFVHNCRRKTTAL